MNINLTLPESFLTRYLSAIERLAEAAERIAGPKVEYDVPKPYGPEFWMESSNAQSRQTEEEERQEAAGFGPSYQRELEIRAAEIAEKAAETRARIASSLSRSND